MGGAGRGCAKLSGRSFGEGEGKEDGARFLRKPLSYLVLEQMQLYVLIIHKVSLRQQGLTHGPLPSAQLDPKPLLFLPPSGISHRC